MGYPFPEPLVLMPASGPITPLNPREPLKGVFARALIASPSLSSLHKIEEKHNFSLTIETSLCYQACV